MSADRINLPALTHERAVAQIMEWFQAAEVDLVGREVVTFRGAKGVITELRLDSDHGIMFTLEPAERDEKRFYPVSTIRTL